MVVITATKSSGNLYPQIFLYAPDGTLEVSNYDNIQARIDNHTLTQNGWHTIIVEDWNGNYIGNFGLCLNKIPSTLNPIKNLSPHQGEITGLSVLLEWEAPGAIAFDLYFGNAHPISMIANDIADTEFLATNLEPDSYHFWHVVAKYAGGNAISGPYGWFLPAPCEGDFDSDDDVDLNDILTFMPAFGTDDCSGAGNCESDLDNDNDIDGKDLNILIKDIGRTDCPQ